LRSRQVKDASVTHQPDSDDSQRACRAALVTGSSHGIGAGIGARLLRDGWTVYGLDRLPATLTSDRFHPIKADVSREGDVKAACDRIGGETGRLHGLVSNAGFMVRKPLAELSLEEWSSVLATNLTSLFLLAREAGPLLRGTGTDAGAIVAIASTRAHMSERDTESYSASKGGLVALTHALAISLGPEIRANCISPGWIDVSGDPLLDTDHAQHPAGRVGRVDDIAALAAWLLGPESGFVTGAEFVSDGGMTRKMIYAE
jgi:NAD(P)-dependent dehydrogenase (short-subunit alcohol dehydrogenase family)